MTSPPTARKNLGNATRPIGVRFDDCRVNGTGKLGLDVLCCSSKGSDIWRYANAHTHAEEANNLPSHGTDLYLDVRGAATPPPRPLCPGKSHVWQQNLMAARNDNAALE